jgi:hypothetical protein
VQPGAETIRSEAYGACEHHDIDEQGDDHMASNAWPEEVSETAEQASGAFDEFTQHER